MGIIFRKQACAISVYGRHLPRAVTLDSANLTSDVNMVSKNEAGDHWVILLLSELNSHYYKRDEMAILLSACWLQLSKQDPSKFFTRNNYVLKVFRPLQ